MTARSSGICIRIFTILAFRRNNPLSQKKNATYGELIITNYDPRPYLQPQVSMFPAEIENGDLYWCRSLPAGHCGRSIWKGKNTMKKTTTRLCLELEVPTDTAERCVLAAMAPMTTLSVADGAFC